MKMPKLETKQHILEPLVLIHQTNDDVFELSFLDFSESKKPTDEFETLSLNVEREFHKMSVHRNNASVLSKKELDRIKNDYNIDGDSIIKNGIEYELEQSEIQEFIQVFEKEAVKNVNYSKLEKIYMWFLSIFNKTYTQKTKVKSVKQLISKILMESNMIAARCRIGPANYVIMSVNMANRISDESPRYIMSSGSTEITDISKLPKTSSLILNKHGMLGGLEIYTYSLLKWTDNRIFIGRKPSENQTGIYFVNSKKDEDIKEIDLENGGRKFEKISKRFIGSVGEKSGHLGYSILNIKFK